MIRYYKFLNPDRQPIYGNGQWPEPGVWAPKVENVVACASGYHACTVDQLVHWIGPELWEIEYDDPPQTHGNKVVGGRARLVRRIDDWNETTARLFAADCAEHVLHLYETAYPDDDRPRQAIETARRYATGEATAEQLDAARDAAWYAAGAAARYAARDAAWYAAGAAARYAAGDAAWYAAGAAARDAAWYAARDAARYAAGDAARYAARYAARDAEQAWQTGRLVHYTRIGS